MKYLSGAAADQVPSGQYRCCRRVNKADTAQVAKTALDAVAAGGYVPPLLRDEGDINAGTGEPTAEETTGTAGPDPASFVITPAGSAG